MFKLTPITNEEKPSVALTTDSFITETYEIENESDYQNEYDFSNNNIQDSPSESNNSETVTIECAGRFEPDYLEVGKLVVTSGSIVACDPLCFSDIEPFIVSVPKGSFPVVIGMTHFENGNHIVTDATVHFSYEKVVEWQPALIKSQNPYYSGEEISDYAVDSGTGCFMDAEVAELLLSKIKDESYRHYVIAKLLRNPIHDCK